MTIVSQNYTYAKLQELIPQYLQRNDPTFLALVPNFITLAENRLATEMKQQGFQAVVTGQFIPGNAQPKPAFWRETISFKYSVNGIVTPLYLRSLEYCQTYWPNPAQTGAPKYYADYNIANFYMAASPDAAYTFELVYYARLEPLTDEHQENWMTLNAPQALLYACCLEAVIWAKNDAKIQLYKGEYTEAVASLLGENKERLIDRNSGVQPR